jgi:hypothetical protein
MTLGLMGCISNDKKVIRVSQIYKNGTFYLLEFFKGTTEWEKKKYNVGYSCHFKTNTFDAFIK